MIPTINKDFTPEQISRYKEQTKSRKRGEGNEPIEMQCLKPAGRGILNNVRITVWQASLIDRLRLLLTGKCYLTMTGTPMVWIDVQKPYNRNELIQNTHRPKQPETAQKKTLTPVGGLGDLADAVKGE